jgi:hydroxyethylthiazole kinase-like uncharacterized protein yjeF
MNTLDLDETALYSVTQLRALEQAAQPLLPPHTLMHRAGEAAAAAALHLIGADAAGQRLSPSAAVLVAAGPGNNGGDAFECAARLADSGCSVTVLLPPATSTPASPDHLQALALLRTSAATLLQTDTLSVLCTRQWTLVIDGLFGIGLARPLTGHWATTIAALNAIDAPLLALDVPSGLDADTGAILTDATGPGACIEATHTITFIGDKPGLHTCDGRDQAGIVSIATLDIDAALFPAPLVRLNRPEDFLRGHRPRRQNSHKGSFGDVQVIGGAPGMAGAAILAGLGALKSGCGRVLIGFADAASRPPFIPGHPELMCRDGGALDFSEVTLVVGPGLGDAPSALTLLAAACASDAPMVLDADGLNLLAATPSLQQAVAARAARQAPTILTPHPLEAARLLGITAKAVQANRLHAAGMLAAQFNATVILKGSGTVIANGDALLINPTGNPALATGGTGDVLAGICGALLAQGWPVDHAAAAAVWIHGAAADRLVAEGIGPIGMTAGELIDAARAVLNQLV